MERVAARAHEFPASIARLAEAARQPASACFRMTTRARKCAKLPGAGRPHRGISGQRGDRARGRAAGDNIVFGAPNVVRGGSHTGWTKAADMIAKGLCSVLASDYYYPAQLLAAFRLASDGVVPLAQAWHLISAAPARAVGLPDRGDTRRGSAPTSSWSMTGCRCGHASSPSSPAGAWSTSPKPTA